MVDDEGRVVILRAYHGTTSGREKNVYATLYDAVTKELLVSADIPYVLCAIEERGYIIAKEKNP